MGLQELGGYKMPHLVRVQPGWTPESTSGFVLAGTIKPSHMESGEDTEVFSCPFFLHWPSPRLWASLIGPALQCDRTIQRHYELMAV